MSTVANCADEPSDKAKHACRRIEQWQEQISGRIPRSTTTK